MGGGSDLKRLSGNQNLLLGMVSGCGSKMINYPLLVWKNASQQGLKIEMNPKKLYRGLPVGMLNLGGTTAVQFWATGFFQKLISQSQSYNVEKGERERERERGHVRIRTSINEE